MSIEGRIAALEKWLTDITSKREHERILTLEKTIMGMLLDVADLQRQAERLAALEQRVAELEAARPDRLEPEELLSRVTALLEDLPKINTPPSDPVDHRSGVAPLTVEPPGSGAQSQALCECGHERGHHNPNGGRCFGFAGLPRLTCDCAGYRPRSTPGEGTR